MQVVRDGSLAVTMEHSVLSGSAAKLVQRTYGRKRPRIDGEECAVAYPAAAHVGHHPALPDWDVPDVNVSAASLHIGNISTSVSSPFPIHSLCHSNLASEGDDGQLPDLIPASKQTPHTYGTQQPDPVGAGTDSIDQLGYQGHSQIVPSPPLLLSTPVSTTASSASFCTATTYSGGTGKGVKAGLITSFFSGSGGLLSLPPGRPQALSQRYAATPSLVRPRAGGGAGEGDGKAHGLAHAHRAGSGSGSSALPSPAPALLQLHLDLGQRTLGSITCPACSMLYTPGLEVDEQSHALYCARKGTGEGVGTGQAGSMPTACIPFPGWKHARWATPAFPPRHPSIRILHITHEDMEGAHARVRSKVAEVDELLARVLGAESAPNAGGDVSRFWAIGSMPGQGGGLHGGGSQAVLGVVVVQRLGEAQRARRIQAEWSTDSEAARGASPVQGGRVKLSIAAGTVWERAVLGVAQVWVHPSQRRRGVARILLDAARAHAVWAYPVPLSELAFTQPTQDGYILAARYTGTEAFLVY